MNRNYLVIDLNKKWKDVPLNVSRRLALRLVSEKIVVDDEGSLRMSLTHYPNEKEVLTVMVDVEEITKNVVVLSTDILDADFYMSIEKTTHFNQEGYGIQLFMQKKR